MGSSVSNQSKRNYQVYTALLSQTGILNPTVIVLENTIGEIQWTRDAQGNYLANSDNLFIVDKTWLCLTSDDYSYFYEFGYGDASTLYLDSKLRSDSSDTDSALSKTPIEIRIYS